ncbi:amino acid starvation-responsive transcription factor GCN4 [Aspergillus lucknowensis]|uniref:BZIP domain-containing protein n=1 Tax=Aspergillus lucknowensis TaxID=176173 RepID=A0ABR4LLT3_9EURO
MSTPNMAQDLFGVTSDQLCDDLAQITDSGMFSPQVIPTGFMVPKDGDVPEGTVSPKDLVMDSSAPPSASFTDLSTPLFESPAWSEDTSPLFENKLDLAAGHEHWGSLFPDDMSLPFDPTCLEIATSVGQVKPESPASPAVELVSPPVTSPAVRGSATRHLTVAGVNARQRKPLAPIKYDESDPVAVKRARNTEAARKSRARKLERQGDMERRIAELEKQLEEAQRTAEYWKTIARNQGC